jgi:hypothetical protein
VGGAALADPELRHRRGQAAEGDLTLVGDVEGTGQAQADRRGRLGLEGQVGEDVLHQGPALGHHSAAFTLETYVHLLEGEEAPALDLADALGGGNSRATHATESDRTRPEPQAADLLA